MNCSEAPNLLSAYYDGELPDDLRERMLEHVRRCSDCSRELQAFEHLSQMASTLSIPLPPEDLWQRIETRFDREPTPAPSHRRPSDRFTRRMFSSLYRVALVAMVLTTVGVSWYLLRSGFSVGNHNHFTAEFGEYLSEFQRDPNIAQRILLARYEHYPVEPDQVLQDVGYLPMVTKGVPPEYKVESTFVTKMPNCTCVQSLCMRPDGSTLAIFEHTAKPPFFGNRPSITVDCQGRKCQMVELDNSTAASWKSGDHYITLIGAQNLREVDRMVSWLTANESGI